MVRAIRCAAVETRLYLRSGRVILPLLLTIGYPLIFYAITPVDVVSSFAMSTVAAFTVGAWIALSRAWSEDARLAQILSVKAGIARFAAAQEVLTAVICLSCALVIAGYPLVSGTLKSGFFTRALNGADWAAALSINACAAICGGAFGGLFHPRLIADRKLAYILCILLCLLGATGGMAGLPLAVRALFPPLYDLLTRAGEADAFPAGYVPALSLWLLVYALAASAARTALLVRRRF